jgi:Fe-S oxidoreductase
MLQATPTRWLLHRWLGIDARRRLPSFSRRRFTRWFGARTRGARHAPNFARDLPARGRVVLLVDTFTEFYYPSIGRAAVNLLEAVGCDVVLSSTRCCGRPMISNGMLRQAQHLARTNIERLRTLAGDGAPIVGLEPSCAVTLKDEYPDLVPGAAAEAVARQTFMVEEYLQLLRERGVNLPLTRREYRLLLHGHCHQKAMVGTGPSLSALRAIPGAEVQEVDSGCCGMAGSFGFEAEHYETSLAMGGRALFGAVREFPADGIVVAAGASCRQQIFSGTGRRALHLVEVLASALDGADR